MREPHRGSPTEGAREGAPVREPEGAPPRAREPSDLDDDLYDFVKFGQGASKNFGFAKHLCIALTLGVASGLVWKTMHWNERKYVAQYYYDLAKKEAKDKAAYQETINAKFADLEAELAK
eukprot:gene5209-18437_t